MKVMEATNIRIETELPHGTYSGIWHGYTVIVNDGAHTYTMDVPEGVRGWSDVNVISDEKGVHVK